MINYKRDSIDSCIRGPLAYMAAIALIELGRFAIKI